MISASHSAARKAIERVLGTDRLDDAAEGGYEVPGASAAVAARPTSIDELSQVLAEANRLNLSVAPYGGGTRMELGNHIDRLDVVADLTGLDKLIEHNPADLTCRVEAGIRVSQLRRELAAQGQLLALDPPLPDRATIGGTLTSATGGPMKLQFGNLRDLVIGMKVVQADGRVVKSGGQVVKNVSGYDMARLHIGGLGTLGVIAEVAFKLAPLPARETTLLGAFDSHSDAVMAGVSIMHSGMTPMALTSFDETANAAVGLLPSSQGHHLAIRLGGRPRTLQRMADDSSSIARTAGAKSVETLDEATAGSLWRRLADFGWEERPKSVMACRVSALPTAVGGLAELMSAEEVSGGLRTATVCQPGYGTLQIFWFADGEAVHSHLARRVLARARQVSHDAGGSMAIERCPADVKAEIDMWDDVGEPIAIMRRLKSQYDPKSTLNPGRFVAGI